MLHSFPIHEAQCRDLFEKRESQKPPKERRKCPEDPMKGYTPNMSAKALDELNAASYKAWSEQALVRCGNCNRTFLPEKLPIHQRSCTADRPARRVDEAVNAVQSSFTQAELFSAGRGQQNARYNEPDDAYLANSGDMIPCKNCGRRFNANSYAKHARVCAKVFTQKRKVFNSAKQRIQGTELEAFQKQATRRGGGAGSGVARRTTGSATGPSAQTASSGGGGGGGQGGIPKWKLDSMRFRAAMKEARAVSPAQEQSKATGVPLHLLLPPPKPSSGGYRDSGYGGAGYDEPTDGLRCPTCGRTFSQKAGERHIPQCKNIINKPTRLLRGSGAPSYSSPESAKTGPRGSFGTTGRAVGGFAGASSGSGLRQSGFDYDRSSVPSGRSAVPSGQRNGFSNTTSSASGLAMYSSGSRPGSATGSGSLVRASSGGAVRRSTGLSNTIAGSSGGGSASRPSPRLSELAAPRTGGGIVSARGGYGGGGGDYRLSTSNATSKDNPLLFRG